MLRASERIHYALTRSEPSKTKHKRKQQLLLILLSPCLNLLLFYRIMKLILLTKPFMILLFCSYNFILCCKGGMPFPSLHIKLPSYQKISTAHASCINPMSEELVFFAQLNSNTNYFYGEHYLGSWIL